MIKLFIALVILIVSLAYLSRSAEAVPIIDPIDNKLNGATDILVNGTYYDVSFIDADGASIFNGYTDLTFTTLSDAIAASQALLDYVLIGDYDTDPTLTRGILSLYNSRAFIVTPYEVINFNLRAYAAENTPNVMDGITTIYAGLPSSLFGLDYSTYPFAVWAVWTESAAPVPEPSTVLLLGSCLVGLAWYGRKRGRYKALIR